MALGRWLSSHRPIDIYKEVKGAHQTADGAIWLGSEVNHDPSTLLHGSHPLDGDEVTIFPVSMSEDS